MKDWLPKDHLEETILVITKERCAEYMELLKWLADNPMDPISVSNLVLSRRER
jgi:hypothetical protein